MATSAAFFKRFVEVLVCGEFGVEVFESEFLRLRPCVAGFAGALVAVADPGRAALEEERNGEESKEEGDECPAPWSGV